MATYTASDIVGKTLATGTKSVKAVRTPGGPTVATIPRNSTIGKVYSWIQRPEGVYWMFETSEPYFGTAQKAFYVLHEQGLKILDKDVRSQEQKKYDELNWFQKVFTPSPEQEQRREEVQEGVKKTAVYLALGIAAFFLIKDWGRQVIDKKIK